MELHTFSSAKRVLLYKGSMESADDSNRYFSHEVVKHKKLSPITKELVADSFGGDVLVLNDTQDVLSQLKSKSWKDAVLLMMS